MSRASRAAQMTWRAGQTAGTQRHFDHLVMPPIDPPTGVWDGNPNNPTDDPNPDYSGPGGRMPVTSFGIPTGYPTPDTTGLVGIGVDADTLPKMGSMTVDVDGAVIEDIDFEGRLRIEANNVTVRRCRVTSNALWPVHLVSGFDGLVMEDVRIRALTENATNSCFMQGAAELRRIHSSGGADSFKTNSSDYLLEDSYAAGNWRITGVSHNDVIQINGGSNYEIRHNTLLAPYQATNSAIILQAKAGGGGSALSNVLAVDNYLSGGGFTIFNSQVDFPMTNVQVNNNLIEMDSQQFGWLSTKGTGHSRTGNQFWDPVNEQVVAIPGQ